VPSKANIALRCASVRSADMTRFQIGLTLAPELGGRISAAAKARHMTAPALVQACIEFYLPVIEAGLHGNPFGEPLLAQWTADLEEAKGRLAAATSAPSRASRKPAKAA